LIEFDSSSFDSGISAYVSSRIALAMKGLKASGERLKEKSVARTPIDTGELRSRAFVSPVTSSEDSMSVTVGYESEDPLYAVYVHERTDVHHKIGQAKFLESSLHEMSSEFLSMMKEVLEK